jgi:hypothetical protein
VLIVHCPICRAFPAQPALEEYTVTVKSKNENELGGLCVYQCTYGHVFFIREADLQVVKATTAA